MQSENCILRASYECLYRMCENSRNTVVVGCLLLRNNYIVWDLDTYGMIKLYK